MKLLILPGGSSSPSAGLSSSSACFFSFLLCNMDLTYGSLWCDLVALVVSGDGCWAPMRARLKTWFGARRLYYDALARRCFAALIVAMSTKWLVNWLRIRSKSCDCRHPGF
ncbi:uncharacterized protein [Triticum aestivum]|uniref:uncharacterized protein n=1 Tax=Triticum aestivum TaxID=4565 RepID=UPI001D002F6A|nr:uncharacterized protein LOC123086858 [Triticum aestivum]